MQNVLDIVTAAVIFLLTVVVVWRVLALRGGRL